MLQQQALSKPNIFESSSVSDFVTRQLMWLDKNIPQFSIRGELKDKGSFSPSLVTQVAKGRRKLTLNRVNAFANLLRLTPHEKNYLESWISSDRNIEKYDAYQPMRKETFQQIANRAPSNHLLSDWANVYVKDCVQVKDFTTNPKVIQKMLGNLLKPERIKKCLHFLMRHGFLRRDENGSLVENESVTTTTSHIPDKKIRTFHKRSLQVAIHGIDNFSLQERRAKCVVMALNKEDVQKLKEIVDAFHQKVTAFAEEVGRMPGEKLYQLIINLCPVSGRRGNIHD